MNNNSIVKANSCEITYTHHNHSSQQEHLQIILLSPPFPFITIFRGDKVSILYDPGLFPTIFENGVIRNGGIPQKGDLKLHLRKFEQDVDKNIPDKDNNGLAIIDFELWRPVYRQNFGKFQIYKNESIELVRDEHPHYTMEELNREADRMFTESAKNFMLETIELGKQLRPNAKVQSETIQIAVSN